MIQMGTDCPDVEFQQNKLEKPEASFPREAGKKLIPSCSVLGNTF